MAVDQLYYDKKNIEINGSEWHLFKLAEEAAELVTAILQWKNKGYSFEDIKKEIADVKIGIRYFELAFGTDEIDRYIKLKEKRINRKVRKQMEALENND